MCRFRHLRCCLHATVQLLLGVVDNVVDDCQQELAHQQERCLFNFCQQGQCLKQEKEEKSQRDTETQEAELARQQQQQQAASSKTVGLLKQQGWKQPAAYCN